MRRQPQFGIAREDLRALIVAHIRERDLPCAILSAALKVCPTRVRADAGSGET
jgi:hypothetical protein